MDGTPDFDMASDGAIAAGLPTFDPTIYDPHVATAMGCLILALLLAIGLAAALLAEHLASK